MDMNNTQQPQQQEWTSFGTVIGNIAVNIKSPKYLIIGEGGSIDMPIAEVSLVDGDYIVKDLILDNADISSVLVTAYQSVALGRQLASRVNREKAQAALGDALRMINRAGAGKVIANTQDNGEFEFDGSQITWFRVVSGTTVQTNYSHTVLQTEDGSISHGTWIKLTSTIGTVEDPQRQYLSYAKAYMGEDE